MKNFIKIDSTNRNLLLLVAISFSAILKSAYALTRNLFESGPDANGYIPFALGFAQNNFFSSEIMGPPYYPSGYPFLLSLLARFSPENWVMLSQVLQIILFSIATYLLYLILEHYFSWQIAMLSSLLLSFSPAWAVANGEAMYETFLLAFLIFSVFFLVAPRKEAKRFSKEYLMKSGILASVAMVIHPRVIPLFLVIYLVFFLKRVKGISSVLVLSISTSIIPLIFAARNLRAKDSFTLMSSFWETLTWNPILAGCKAVTCVADRVLESPFEFLEQCYLNGIRFWSPHSGPLMRGTWLHNVSLQAQLNSNGFHDLAILISQLFSIFIFLSWVCGSVLLHKKNSMGNTFLLSLTTMIWATDILVYGESRHRLIALLFMLPAHAACIIYFGKIYSKKGLPRFQTFWAQTDTQDIKN